MCLLTKSLYGLKQAPLAWNHTIDTHLHQNGFVPTVANPCIYTRGTELGIAFIALYVDDCIIITDQKQVNEVKGWLHIPFV